MDFADKKLNSAFQGMRRFMSEKEARIILARHTPYDWGDIVARPDVLLSQEQVDLIQKDTKERLAGKPLSRIYGENEFWGLNFFISPETLDPRPDTETIIDIAKHRFGVKQPEMILDLGTGSGCILIALLHEFKNSQGIGVDLSYEALQTAQKNAQRNNAADRAMFCCSNWAAAISGKFDLIVSNPPYISNQIIPSLDIEVRNHDPILALDGGKDGLKAYRQIFSDLKNILNPSGIALFEIGYDQGDSVSRLAAEHGFSVVGIYPDLAGQPRVVEISCGDK